MKRREFTQVSILAAGAAIAPPWLHQAAAATPPREIRKGIMWSCIGYGTSVLDKFQAAKAAGFDGVEVMSHMDRNEVLKAREATGLVIPSVCGALHGKYSLSDPDPAIRKLGMDALRVTLEDAKAYGADTVLLIPGRVSDAVGYDECWDRAVEGLKKMIPVAESLGVTIAIENVWNNFLLSPLETARFIDQFNSPSLKAYFDCGNVLVIGWPEQWIRVLGQRIRRIHIKEYSRKIAEKQGKWAGFNVPLLEGDNNWPVILKALDGIGYKSWATIEQPGGDTPEGLKDLCVRLTKILGIQS